MEIKTTEEVFYEYGSNLFNYPAKNKKWVVVDDIVEVIDNSISSGEAVRIIEKQLKRGNQDGNAK